MNLDFLFNWMDRCNMWAFNRKCRFYRKKLNELKKLQAASFKPQASSLTAYPRDDRMNL
jgi:hypothetical protein